LGIELKRITLFAKGNVDVHDSLHSCRVGGELLWNGINDVLRQTNPTVTVRLRHETLTRSDALLAAEGKVPAGLEGRDMDLGTYPLQSQFSQNVYTQASDAVILSILPDVASTLKRHKSDGYFLYPAESTSWTESNRIWLRDEFETMPHLSVEQSMENLASVVDRIRQFKDVPILIYNLSPIIPGDFIHCYMGLDDTYSTRIRRFNLALIELSQAIGISIVDLDSVLARHGADQLKIDAMHLTPEGYRFVAEDVVRILDDLGVLEDEGN
jgi:lysophospholipase L1-like esterase